jgi:hypothetical protein
MIENKTVPENSSRILASLRPRHGVYHTDQGTLFVPTEDMWIVHEASKASAIEKRASLQEGAFLKWKSLFPKRWPELAEWLYGAQDPPFPPWRRRYWTKASAASSDKMVSWFSGDTLPDGTIGLFMPSAEMIAFCKEASISGITRASIRMPDQVGADVRMEQRKEHVSHRLINEWCAEYSELAWFRNWLLRGMDTPSGIDMATPSQIRRCKKAWDYIGHCERVGISPENTYMTGWLKGGTIPPDTDWLLWLYGYNPPVGVFVVPLLLQMVRLEMTPYKICLAAKIDSGKRSSWGEDAAVHAAANEAIEVARMNGGREGHMAAWAKTKTNIHPATLNSICKYAVNSTLKACCERAGTTPDKYYRWRKEAEKLGVHETFDQYMHMEGPFSMEGREGRIKRSMLLKSGLVSEGFFVPTPAMIAFRDTALTAVYNERVGNIVTIPGGREWFVDWVTPRRSKTGRANGHPVDDPHADISPADEEIEPRPEEAEAIVTTPATDASQSQTGGITITQAAAISGVNKGIISRAASKGEIASNGLAGRKLRLDSTNFTQWALTRANREPEEEDHASVERQIQRHVMDPR